MSMSIAEWRRKKGWSQDKLAEELEVFAIKNHPQEKRKRVSQRTISDWERGAMPRPFWLRVIKEFTKNKVTSDGFVSAAVQDA